MKYMVTCRLQPDTKNTAIEAFENRGPNRSNGVKYCGAWIAKDADMVFVLVESTDEQQVRAACTTWEALKQYEIHPVTDVEHF